MPEAFEPKVVEFVVDAGRRYVYRQWPDFVDIGCCALVAKGNCKTDQGDRPLRAGLWPDVSSCCTPQSVWLLKRDEPGESEQTALSRIDHGLCELRVLLKELSPVRTLVTVMCLTREMLPAMDAMLREFARRYPEAAEQIEETWPAAETAQPVEQPSQLPEPKGAPRLEERPDWQERCKKAREYQKLVASGRYTAEGAAAYVGINPKTMQRVLKRMEELGILTQ